MDKCQVCGHLGADHGDLNNCLVDDCYCESYIPTSIDTGYYDGEGLSFCPECGCTWCECEFE